MDRSQAAAAPAAPRPRKPRRARLAAAPTDHQLELALEVAELPVEPPALEVVAVDDEALEAPEPIAPGRPLRAALAIRSFKVERALFDRDDLTTIEKLIHVNLAMRADADSTCFPSYEKIASDCSISRRSAIRGVQTLERLGLVVRHSEYNDSGRQRSNRFEVCTLEHRPEPTPSRGDTESPAGVTQSHPYEVRAHREGRRRTQLLGDLQEIKRQNDEIDAEEAMVPKHERIGFVAASSGGDPAS